MNKVRTIRWFLITATGMLCLGGVTRMGMAATAGQSASDGRVHLRLEAAAGITSIHVDGSKAVTLNALQASKQAQLFGGVAVSLTKDEQFLMIQARDREVVIEAEGAKDWAAKVGTNDMLQVRYVPAKRVIDFITPSGNEQPVVMRFVDGAKAAVKAGSAARLDYFDDQSYYFSGQGQVGTANADGLDQELNPQWPPMAGGPLVSTNAVGKGARHMLRVTPLTLVSIGGDLKEAINPASTSTNRSLTILVGTERISLKPGETRKVTTPNGSTIDLSFPSDRPRLEWKVGKGLFQITLQSIECWAAMSLTDQAGSCQWDAGSRAIDIENTTSPDQHAPTKPILCALSGAFTGRGARVALGPKSLFQYIQIQACDLWSGGGRGDVKLYTPSKQQFVDLAKGNLLVRSGLPIGGGANVPKQKVGLAWDARQPLDLTSSKGGARIDPDSQQTVSQGDLGDLNVKYTSPGLVSTAAAGGSYSLEPRILNNWTFDLLEGDGLTFNLDRDGGLFVVRADPKNSYPVRVGTPSQPVPMLWPGDSLTFVLPKTGTPVLSSVSDAIYIFEPAGASPPSALANAPYTAPLPDGRSTPVPFGSPIDPLLPHIVEPPVTVSGNESVP